MGATPPSSANDLPAKSNAAANDDLASGLTSDEARAPAGEIRSQRDARYERASLAHGARKILGAGSVDARGRGRARTGLGKYVEAAIIAALLVFNAALGLFQESRAQATLAALKSRLALNASVRRDGAWKTIPAAELVPGDVVKLSLGAVVAADVQLTGGEVLLDQSMLTGESVPIEAGAGVADLCRRAGAAGRGGGGGHGDRSAHQVRPHRGARPHRPCRQFPAEGGSARGAQSRRVQRRRHRRAGGLCLAFSRCRSPRSSPSS